MERFKNYIILGLLILLFIAGAVLYWNYGAKKVSKEYHSTAPINLNPVHISMDADGHEHALQKAEKFVSQKDFDALQDKYTKLAHSKETVETKVQTVYVHDSIFFHDTIDNPNVISVPKNIREVKHWHKIVGKILKTGEVFDTIQSIDSIHVGFGTAKDSTLWQKINIFKVKDIHAEVTNYNPDSKIIGMKSSIYIPTTPWYLSTTAKIIVGAAAGITGYKYLTK